MEPIVLSGVSKSFGGKAVLRDFSAVFPNPGLTAIMGSSGAGKTTLIRILLGLIRPDAGHITGLSGLTPSVVFQENRLFPGLSALENAEAAGVRGKRQVLAGTAGAGGRVGPPSPGPQRRDAAAGGDCQGPLLRGKFPRPGRAVQRAGYRHPGWHLPHLPGGEAGKSGTAHYPRPGRGGGAGRPPGQN